MAISELQNFYKETVAVDCTTGATNIYVSTKPTPINGYLVISPGNESLREIIKYTGTGTDGTGDYVTIALAGDRGLGGTTDQAHISGEAVRMNYTAEHQQEIDDTINAIVAAGAPNASTTVKGISKLSAAPADAAEPIAVGTNDTRMNVGAGMTVDEKAALAGGGAFGTPDTDNKFLTEDIVDNLPALFVTGVSKKITTNPSTADLSGIQTEQNILTATLPANSLGTSNAVKLKVFISNWSHDSNSCTIRLKYGSTTISSIVLNSTSERNGLAGIVEALLVSDGATDAQMGSIFVDLSDISLNASGGDPAGSYLRQVTSGSATEDSTGALTLSLTVQWSAFNAGNDLVLAGGVIELIS